MADTSGNPLRQDKRGATAIEFALVLPVLITILMGAIEFGLILYTYNTSENAARDVTRRLATNRLTTAQVSDEAKAQLPTWARTDAIIAVSQTTPTVPATNRFTVGITIPANKATPTTFLGWAYASVTLNSAVTLQQEQAQ